MIKKNKITTPGYFIKRLRDNGYIVNRIFDSYQTSDPRKFTLLVNPNHEACFLTLYENVEFLGNCIIEFNDGAVRFPKNYQLSTESIEVVITYLIKHGIQPETGRNAQEKSS